jgi:YesN/AraC family two-component response regulator
MNERKATSDIADDTSFTDRADEGEKGQVLIVEDDPEIANFMKGLLAESHAITIVCDGKSALENVESQDVVVLDYRLPDMSGLEVLRKIKRMRPDIPVIFITAYGDEDVAVKAFRYGVRDYLKKPFHYSEFLHSLNSCLSLARIDKRQPRRVLLDDVDTITSGIVDAINRSAIKYNLQNAIIYINNNYTSKITLDKVSKEACTSRYHFSREFKKAIGCTYTDYVNKMRIEKARALLKNERISITEAAFSVGYPNLTNFGRIFKKIVGCTPKEYKHRQKQAGSGELP